MKSQKILIVDDEPLNISLYFDMLQQDNFQIISAADGIEAVQKTHEELPDLIIMDWNMPRLDGLEALKKLKGVDKTKNIPVIMITGIMTSSESLMTALNEGAIDFLRKPFDKIEFKARVQSMLLLSGAMKSLNLKNIEIENNLRFIQSLIDNITHMLVYYNLDGIVMGCNQQFIQFIGIPVTEIVGSLIYRYCNGGNSATHMIMDMELINQQVEMKYESSMNNGQDFIFSKTLFCDTIGEPQGILCVMTDISNMKKAHLKMMEQKKKELVSSALRLIQSNEINNQLILELGKLNGFTNKEGSENIRQLIRQYTNSSTDGVWKDFEARFEQVYESFYKHLRENFPDLTSGERKLCALIRLSLSTKDIAAITSQNPQSVDMARYRLRKKLQLGADTNLNDFLFNIVS